MAIRTPIFTGLAVQPDGAGDANNPAASAQEGQAHRFWSRWTVAANLPNAAANAASAATYDAMRPGDVALVEADGNLYRLDDRGTVSGSDAVWTAQAAAAAAAAIESTAGAWTVPIGAAVGDMLYATAAFTAALADNSGIGTAPVLGTIKAKPTGVTATVIYSGEAAVFVGLTVAAEYFLGTAGGIVTPAPVAPAGTVVQRVGVAASATVLLFHPDPTEVVL